MSEVLNTHAGFYQLTIKDAQDVLTSQDAKRGTKKEINGHGKIGSERRKSRRREDGGE